MKFALAFVLTYQPLISNFVILHQKSILFN